MPQATPATPAAPAGPAFNLGGAFLLTGLATALVALGSSLTSRFLPAWQPGYLTAACFLVALETALVQYRMRLGRHFELGALRYLAAELFALIALMRVVASLSSAGSSLSVGFATWVRDPLTSLDVPFLVCVCVGLITAVIVRGGMRQLASLEPVARLVIPSSAIDADTYRTQVEGQQHLALARLGAGIAWGGALALLALVFQVLNLEQIGGAPRPLPTMSGLAGMVYTTCAILLYSRARLGLLRSRWQRDETMVDPSVISGWRRSSTALVLAVALGGLLLPRSYGLGLLDMSRSGAAIVLNIVALLALLLGVISIGVFSLLITIPLLILFLITRMEPSPSAPMAPILPPPAPPPTPPSTTEPPLLPGLIFWACMTILALYAIWVVLRRQSWAQAAWQRLRAGALGQIWHRLLTAWRRAISEAKAIGADLAERLRPPPAPEPRHSPPRRRLGRLAPRELIAYFYSSTLEQAARHGLGRRRAATPFEYSAELREQLPEAADDIAGLTESYVRAAYAPRPVTPEEARAASNPWRRLQRALRRRAAERQAEGEREGKKPT